MLITFSSLLYLPKLKNRFSRLMQEFNVYIAIQRNSNKTNLPIKAKPYAKSSVCFFSKKTSLFLALLIFQAASIFAQEEMHAEKHFPFYIKPALHYGFVAAHKPNMTYFVNGHFPSLEIDIGVNTLGEKKWHHLYALPDYGITYFHSGFKNDEVLGKVHALIPYINFPLFKGKSRWQESFKLGTGVGYLTKKNDRFENYKNFIISSHFNAAICLYFETRYLLSDRLTFSGSWGLTHFSNGSISKPNLGINTVTVNTGFKYNMGKQKPIHKNMPSLESDKRKYSFSAIAGWGFKEIGGNFVQKPRYQVYFLETNISRNLSQKSSLLAGADIFYDNSDFVLLSRDSIAYNSDIEIIKPGLHLGHDLKLQNLSVIFLTGHYLYGKEKSDKNIYSRLAIRYTLKNNLLFGISLKSHFAVAEFIGYEIGYKF